MPLVTLRAGTMESDASAQAQDWGGPSGVCYISFDLPTFSLERGLESRDSF